MGEAIKTRRNQAQYINPLLFYEEGFENESVTGGWETNVSAGNGVQSKHLDFIYLELFNNASQVAHRSYITTNNIDFTNINALKWELEGYEADPSNVRILTLNTTKQDGALTWVAFVSNQGNISRDIFTLDTSAITGEYYIRMIMVDNSSSQDRPGKAKIYKVWGE